MRRLARPGPPPGRPPDDGAASSVDNLAAADLTRVAWDPADGLTFPLRGRRRGRAASSRRVPAATSLLADHGESVERHGPDARPDRDRQPRGPVHARAGAAGVPARHGDVGPGGGSRRVDPHGAAPRSRSVVRPRAEWNAVETLLRLRASSMLDVAVETGDDGRAQLRFGDNVFGLMPDEGDVFDVDYRVGVGVDGNVGAETIHHVVEQAA